MKKGIWYTLAVALTGLVLYFVVGWLISLMTIVALTIAIAVAIMFVKRKLD